MEPIVPRLKRLLREKNVSHAQIAEQLGKHRTFITRKLGGESMETRLLEAIMESAGISYQEMFCQESLMENALHEEVKKLREEVNLIKEFLPQYHIRKEENQEK